MCGAQVTSLSTQELSTEHCGFGGEPNQKRSSSLWSKLTPREMDIHLRNTQAPCSVTGTGVLEEKEVPGALGAYARGPALDWGVMGRLPWK